MAGEPHPRSLVGLPRPVKTYHRDIYARLSPASSSFQGKGKTILVTGGATGIGFAIAKAFAEARTSNVHILARNEESLAKAKTALEKHPDVKVVTHSVSLTDYAAVNDVIKQIARIDVLVLSAAVITKPGPTAEVSVAEMEEGFLTNVMGQFNLVKAFLGLPAHGERAVLNVSTAAVQVHLPGLACYSSSKSAFTQIMHHFASERPASETRFMSFHPGTIYTPLASKTVPEDLYDWEEVDLPGQFAVWLASPESAFLHGRFVWAQWDVDELLELKAKVAEEPDFLKISLIH